ASAFEPAEGSPYLFICRSSNCVDQVSGIHEPAVLAGAALRYLFINPCLLHRMKLRPGETIECRDLVSGGRADRRDTRTDRLYVERHRARAALPESATEPRTAKV